MMFKHNIFIIFYFLLFYFLISYNNAAHLTIEGRPITDGETSFYISGTLDLTSSNEESWHISSSDYFYVSFISSWVPDIDHVVFRAFSGEGLLLSNTTINTWQSNITPIWLQHYSILSKIEKVHFFISFFLEDVIFINPTALSTTILYKNIYYKSQDNTNSSLMSNTISASTVNPRFFYESFGDINIWQLYAVKSSPSSLTSSFSSSSSLILDQPFNPLSHRSSSAAAAVAAAASSSLPSSTPRPQSSILTPPKPLHTHLSSTSSSTNPYYMPIELLLFLEDFTPPTKSETVDENDQKWILFIQFNEGVEIRNGWDNNSTSTLPLKDTIFHCIVDHVILMARIVPISLESRGLMIDLESDGFSDALDIYNIKSLLIKCPNTYIYNSLGIDVFYTLYSGILIYADDDTDDDDSDNNNNDNTLQTSSINDYNDEFGTFYLLYNNTIQRLFSSPSSSSFSVTSVASTSTPSLLPPSPPSPPSSPPPPSPPSQIVPLSRTSLSGESYLLSSSFTSYLPYVSSPLPTPESSINHFLFSSPNYLTFTGTIVFQFDPPNVADTILLCNIEEASVVLFNLTQLVTFGYKKIPKLVYSSNLISRTGYNPFASITRYPPINTNPSATTQSQSSNTMPSSGNNNDNTDIHLQATPSQSYVCALVSPYQQHFRTFDHTTSFFFVARVALTSRQSADLSSKTTSTPTPYIGLSPNSNGVIIEQEVTLTNGTTQKQQKIYQTSATTPAGTTTSGTTPTATMSTSEEASQVYDDLNNIETLTPVSITTANRTAHNTVSTSATASSSSTAPSSPLPTTTEQSIGVSQTFPVSAYSDLIYHFSGNYNHRGIISIDPYFFGHLIATSHLFLTNPTYIVANNNKNTIMNHNCNNNNNNNTDTITCDVEDTSESLSDLSSLQHMSLFSYKNIEQIIKKRKSFLTIFNLLYQQYSRIIQHLIYDTHRFTNAFYLSCVHIIKCIFYQQPSSQISYFNYFNYIDTPIHASFNDYTKDEFQDTPQAQPALDDVYVQDIHSYHAFLPTISTGIRLASTASVPNQKIHFSSILLSVLGNHIITPVIINDQLTSSSSSSSKLSATSYTVTNSTLCTMQINSEQLETVRLDYNSETYIGEIKYSSSLSTNDTTQIYLKCPNIVIVSPGYDMFVSESKFGLSFRVTAFDNIHDNDDDDTTTTTDNNVQIARQNGYFTTCQEFVIIHSEYSPEESLQWLTTIVFALCVVGISSGCTVFLLLFIIITITCKMSSYYREYFIWTSRYAKENDNINKSLVSSTTFNNGSSNTQPFLRNDENMSSSSQSHISLSKNNHSIHNNTNINNKNDHKVRSNIVTTSPVISTIHTPTPTFTALSTSTTATNMTTANTMTITTATTTKKHKTKLTSQQKPHIHHHHHHQQHHQQQQQQHTSQQQQPQQQLQRPKLNNYGDFF